MVCISKPFKALKIHGNSGLIQFPPNTEPRPTPDPSLAIPRAIMNALNHFVFSVIDLLKK